MAAAATPRVASIPPGVPFLDTLVDELLSGRLVPGIPDSSDPLALARATILLPTRRAVRALSDVFLARGGPALLLPRMRPIGETDEDERLFEDPDELDDADIELPPPIRPLQRQIALTRLILSWARTLEQSGVQVLVPASPADAAHLARELARLMDMVATEGHGWDALDSIVPDSLQEHWRLTTRFLSIATEHWPRFLAERGLIDPAERRRRLLEAEAARLARQPDAPVIAAGSTGSIPTTARLLATIARLPRGVVVLPGLDTVLDETAWTRLKRNGAGSDPVPSHPQTSLRALLDEIGIERHEVRSIGAPPETARHRAELLSDVMRPADTTDAWAIGRSVDVSAALTGLALVEAQNEREEAIAIALAMRETIEAPDASAALVTPDRMLARRVAAELRRFGIDVDDTAGRPLAETPAGILARLVAEAARDALAPRCLLALIQHPLATFGREAPEARRAARALERLVLRGPAPGPGVDGLLAAVAHLDDRPSTVAAAGVSARDRTLAVALSDQLAAIFRPFGNVLARDDLDLQSLADAHECALDQVLGAGGGADPLERHEDGRAVRQFFAEIGEADASALKVAGREYPQLIASLMSGRTVRRVAPGDPRLHIYGLLEARLVQHDRLVLAGLDEGVWPATMRTDPWLSRLMRADMALPAPERRIGLSAHDLVQALGTQDVVLIRSQRSKGAPTVASRWLQRLSAVVGSAAINEIRARGDRLLTIARALDVASETARPVRAPQPKPPVSARPRRLSVTEIEKLVRDPYSIYARHVLKLRPFEAVAEAPNAAERGTIVHDVLAMLSRAANAGAVLSEAMALDAGRRALAAIAAYPELHAFWWPRLERVLRWFITYEAARRRAGARVLVEVTGQLRLDLPRGPFTLVGRVDRFECDADGGFAVLDFKTGAVAGPKEVRVGFAPQLPLEAALAMRGAFADHGIEPGATPKALVYVKLGGSDPPAELKNRAPDDQPLSAFALATLQDAVRLLARFDSDDTPYRSLAASKWRLKYGDYDHLARVKEWGVIGEGGEE